MRRDLRGIADPQSRHRVGGWQVERIGLLPARQMLGRGGGIGVDRMQRFGLLLGQLESSPTRLSNGTCWRWKLKPCMSSR